MKTGGELKVISASKTFLIFSEARVYCPYPENCFLTGAPVASRDECKNHRVGSLIPTQRRMEHLHSESERHSHYPWSRTHGGGGGPSWSRRLQEAAENLGLEAFPAESQMRPANAMVEKKIILPHPEN